MSKNIVLACLLAGTLAAGCTASMNATVTPGASASPSALPSGTTPTTSASAGASTAPVAGNLNAAMAAMYKAGRKWSYLTTVDTAGQKVMVPFTREVTKVEGSMATVKTVTTVNGKDSETTAQIDLTKAEDPTASFTKSTGADGSVTESTWTQESVATESLTVKAGTYASTKYLGKLTVKSSGSTSGASAGGAQDATFWVNDTVGLLKSVTSGSQTTEAMGQKFTVTFTSTTELQSVSN